MAPSILSADFTRLGDAVALCEAAGAEWIHVDVMDGHFVPNLTIGPPVVKAVKHIAGLPLDVHLMIANPDETVRWYLDAGADLVTVHAEACRDLPAVLREIRTAGAKAGVSIKPGTPVDTVSSVIGELDVVLVMSVEPGFGGQAFMSESLSRIALIRDMAAAAGSDLVIEVDGGIDESTAPLVVASGARMLVAGNAVFGRADPVAALRAIRAAGERVLSHAT
ncbi:MAG: ribulose-phosphate 3-epimerase [Coriobacteriia bacterium]|nr:ribulose-phosphate 3-epimerase [Coriobacteriia bacterium]